MSYTDDAVLAKLSTLSETQDSIVTVAQWIMFHRRHADRTVQIWLQQLKETRSNKRLNLIYLANEVTQQSKARHKEDFLVAFAPVLAEGIATAYKGASSDIQQKVRRVVEVWQERCIFEEPILTAIIARLEEADKARGTGKGGFGGSIFGSSASLPAELSALIAPQQAVSKVLYSTKATVATANQDYDKLMTPGNDVPPAPVYAARLNGLLKATAGAEGAVEQLVKARLELVAALQKALDSNNALLEADQEQLGKLQSRKTEVDDKKREIEHSIMQGLANDDAPDSAEIDDSIVPKSPERPEMEELTPEPDRFAARQAPPVGTDGAKAGHYGLTLPAPAGVGMGMGMLSGVASPSVSVPTAANGAKKRKLDTDDELVKLGDDGIDADVVEMLRKEGGGGL